MILAEFDNISIHLDDPYNEQEYMDYFNTPEVLKNTSLEFEPSKKEYAVKTTYDVPNEKRFIFLKNGKIIGSSDLYNIENHKATIRFWIAQHMWGKGIATKTVHAIIGYAFGTMQLCRIDAYVFTTNPGSIKVLEKIGFKREGLLHHFDKKGDTLIDEYIYAIFPE